MTNQPTSKVTATGELPIQEERDVIPLLRLIRRQTAQVRMNLLSQTKLFTIASELARNMLLYADGGNARVDCIQQGTKTGIRMTFTDRGPGIADVDHAMQDGYTTGTGMGLGLPGSKRLASEFLLTSVVGEGTTVTIILWTNG